MTNITDVIFGKRIFEACQPAAQVDKQIIEKS